MLLCQRDLQRTWIRGIATWHKIIFQNCRLLHGQRHRNLLHYASNSLRNQMASVRSVQDWSNIRFKVNVQIAKCGSAKNQRKALKNNQDNQNEYVGNNTKGKWVANRGQEAVASWSPWCYNVVANRVHQTASLIHCLIATINPTTQVNQMIQIWTSQTTTNLLNSLRHFTN